MTDADYREQERRRQEQEAKREASNAAHAAQRNAQQQAAQQEADREKVHEAFNATYGPQVQRAKLEQDVMNAPSNSNTARLYNQAATRGGPGYRDPFAAAGQYMPAIKPNEMQNTLDWMWRQQTDPYQRTANNMNMMRMFYPTNVMPTSGRSEAGGGGMLTGEAYAMMKKGQNPG